MKKLTLDRSVSNWFSAIFLQYNPPYSVTLRSQFYTYNARKSHFIYYITNENTKISGGPFRAQNVSMEVQLTIQIIISQVLAVTNVVETINFGKRM